MPTADGRFKGLSVPAEAWERIFGAKPAEHTQSPASTDMELRGLQNIVDSHRPRHEVIREAYEDHITILGPDSHSPFIQTFRR